jgi:hypothetical protein
MRMMELGSGIAIAGLCVSGGAVAITAIRTFSGRIVEGSGKDGADGKNGRNGTDAAFPCVAHSGLVASLEGIEKNQDRQEKQLSDISSDIKRLLQK